jgi:regulator of protease activity HflC (stomatin/prohibitin superfamily)
MNRILGIIFALVMLIGVGYSWACWETVPAGNVGIKVHLLGASKGVQENEVLGVGKQWIGWQQELYLYPTFTQNYVWAKSPKEGSDDDESITFQDNQGMSINADVGISYHVEADKAALLFQKYRLGIKEITDGALRSYVRNALNDEAGSMSVEDIYGGGKEKMMDAVQKRVTDAVAPFGIVVEKIYLVNGLRLPENVVKSINAKIQATQNAQQRENEVAQANAQANIDRAKAQGEADAKLKLAEADAKAIQIKGDALRQNQELVSLTLAERWDGHYPSTLYVGTEQGKMLLQMPSAK